MRCLPCPKGTELRIVASGVRTFFVGLICDFLCGLASLSSEDFVWVFFFPGSLTFYFFYPTGQRFKTRRPVGLLMRGLQVSGAHTYYTAPNQPQLNSHWFFRLIKNKGAVGQANPQKTATAVPTPQHRSFGSSWWLYFGGSLILERLIMALNICKKA